MRMIMSPFVLSLLFLVVVSRCQDITAAAAAAADDDGGLPDKFTIADIEGKSVAIIGTDIGGISAAAFLSKYSYNEGHISSCTIFAASPAIVTTNLAGFHQDLVENPSNGSQKCHKHSSSSSAGSLGFWDGNGISRVRPSQKLDSLARVKLMWDQGWNSALAQWVSYIAKTKYLQFSSIPRAPHDWIDSVMGFTGYMSRLQELRARLQPVQFPFRDLHSLYRDLGLEGRDSETKTSTSTYDTTTGLDRKLYNESFSSAVHASAFFEARLRDTIPQPEHAACAAEDLLSADNFSFRLRITTRPHTSVTQIKRLPSGEFSLTWISHDGTEHIDEFGIIIVNTLYRDSNIEFIPAVANPPSEAGLFDLHTTVLATDKQLSTTLLNISSSSSIPDIIVPTTPIFSHTSPPSVPDIVSITCSGCNDPKSTNTYTISSRILLSANHIEQLFDVPASSSSTLLSSIRQSVKPSYSRTPDTDFPPIELDKGIYYITGIERVSGSPEAAILMGRNVARLIVDEWNREQSHKVCGSSGLEDELEPRRKEL